MGTGSSTPANPNPADLTLWLRQMSEGNRVAADAVAAAVYQELHHLAEILVSREHRHHSLQPTVLVNEAFIRLIGGQKVAWQDRRHFYCLCARMMRRILIDYFRDRDAKKRPTSGHRMALEDVVVFTEESRDEVLMVDEALNQLADIDERAAQVVELRYFGGLTVDQIAELLEVSDRTVKRDWDFAQAWLKRYFQSPGSPSV